LSSNIDPNVSPPGVNLCYNSPGLRDGVPILLSVPLAGRR
jgi:hypothetical protein